MTCYQEIVGSNPITKSGRPGQGTQRYRCRHEACSTQTFLLDYRYKAYRLGVKCQVVEMAINCSGSGIRDTGRVLGINKNTVISTLKKQTLLTQVNLARYYTDDWESMSAFRHCHASGWQAEYPENRTKSKHLDQTFDEENPLFFQINFDARHPHWTTDQ